MNRDKTIDVLKGIGIILVVIGHSGCSQLLIDCFHSFMMPLFFIASGFFLERTIWKARKNILKERYKAFICHI